MKTFILILALTFMAFSHQGRLDIHGGHTHDSTGNYHYHDVAKGTNIDPFHSPIRIQILKYGYAHGWGQEFSSIDRCNAEKKMLTRRNKGSDYSYDCVIR